MGKRNGNLLFTIRPIARSNRTMTGRCRSLTEDAARRKYADFLLKTQAERTAKTPIQARRAVTAVCATFAGQPSAYPPEARRSDVAPMCGSVGRKTREQDGSGKSRLQQMQKTLKTGQNRGILDAAARKQDKAAGSCAPLWRSHLPAVRAVSGFTRAFQTQRKTAGGRCGMKKARRFKENRRGSNENTR